MKKKQIYYISENQDFSEKEILDTIQLACQEGVNRIQLRDKTRLDGPLLKLAAKAQKICQEYQVDFIIDDRLDIAMILSCGLHLGQEDIPLFLARKLLGPKAIIGATTKTVDQAIEAKKQGASYLGVGAIYPTNTKVITKITSVSTLYEICQAVDLPVYAIGGLNHDNLAILKDCPIEGICVVSAIARALDKKAAISKLKASLGHVFP